MNNHETTTDDGMDWKAEAEFWQMKYFEQLNHSTQIITALSRPMLVAQAQKRMAPQLAAIKEQIDTQRQAAEATQRAAVAADLAGVVVSKDFSNGVKQS